MRPECRWSRRVLEAAFAGDLEISERMRWETHLGECPVCRKDAEAQGVLLETMVTYREAPPGRVDLDRFVENVQARLDEPGEPLALPNFAGRRHVRWFVALAAALFVTLTWAIWQRPGGVDGSPDGAEDVVAKGQAPEQPGNASSVEPELPSGFPLGPVAPNDQSVATRAGSQVPDPEPGQGHTGDALARVLEQGPEYNDRRRATVLSDLRDFLAQAPGEDAVRTRLDDLRRENWPVDAMLARICEASPDPVANAAVHALPLLPKRKGHSQLWSLRKNDSLGPVAVQILLDQETFDVDQSVRLYWESTHRSAVREWWQSLDGESKLELARGLFEGRRGGRLDGAVCADLAGLLVEGGVAGQVLALEWMTRRGIPQDLWLAELAQFQGWGEAAGEWWVKDRSLPEQQAWIELARLTPGEHWVRPLAVEAWRRPTTDAAIRALALQPGTEALSALHSVGLAPMADGDVWLAAWQSALSEDPGRTLDWIDEVLLVPSSEEHGRVAKSLLLTGSKAPALAYARLASRGLLGESLASKLLEVVAASGDKSCELEMRNRFLALAEHESVLGANLLVALGQLHGKAGVRSALELEIADQPNRTERRIIEWCDPNTPRSFSERGYLIERRLGTWLSSRSHKAME